MYSDSELDDEINKIVDNFIKYLKDIKCNVNVSSIEEEFNKFLKVKKISYEALSYINKTKLEEYVMIKF